MYGNLSKNEETFILEALKNKLRIDERELFEYRRATFGFGKRCGEVTVTLGNTKILVNIYPSLICPKPERPKDGLYRFNIDFSYLEQNAEFHNENEGLNDLRIELSRFVEKVLKSSRAIDTEILCITHGKLAWLLDIQITVMNYAGNLIDPILYALLLSLMSMKLPDVRIEEEKLLVYNFAVKKPMKISVHHLPIAFTFYVYKSLPQTYLLDPDKSEERIADGRITIAINVYKDICGIHSAGKINITTKQLEYLISLVSTKVAATTELIRSAFKEKDVLPIVKIELPQNMPMELGFEAMKNKEKAEEFLREVSAHMHQENTAQIDEEEILKVLEESKGKAEITQKPENPFNMEDEEEEQRYILQGEHIMGEEITEIPQETKLVMELPMEESYSPEVDLVSAIKRKKRKKK